MRFEIEANCPGTSEVRLAGVLPNYFPLSWEEINEPTVKFPFSNRLIFGISTTGMDTSCKKRIHSFKCRRRKWPLHCLAFFATLWSGGQEDVSQAKNGQFFLIRFLRSSNAFHQDDHKSSFVGLKFVVGWALDKWLKCPHE